MRACFARTCCTVAVQERDRRATTLQCNIKRTFSSHFTLHSSHPALHASHLHFTFHSSSYLKSSDFFSPHVTSSDLFSSHPIPSHISSKQVLLNYFQVTRALKKSSQLISAPLHARKLLPIKLAQSTSRYYFVLQSLHKVRPSTTSYYKTCTKYVPVLLCTTKLAQSTSQYFFVLQSLHKVLPSTTSYYKACTDHFRILLRTTKLAQRTDLQNTKELRAKALEIAAPQPDLDAKRKKTRF